MKVEEAKIGMKVKSKVNSFVYAYEIIKTFKTVCWVRIQEEHYLGTQGGTLQTPEDMIFKGVPYRILKPIK